ncbi:hypothetical protein CVIRNUC_005726 [Coccomyxa viridis]|uniref:Uncharacterized protein n=1 Tax=Coccomyxa viridis TaxID=1274662 RepID=A0AAV1I6M9_9CHLO|nr:hypothetical protein CVIRNUC_005726 [Coccomyxa viridis]
MVAPPATLGAGGGRLHHAKSTSDKSLSDFEATLAMLPPRLAARLSLDPSRESSPQGSSQPSTPSEHGSEISYCSIGSRVLSSSSASRPLRHRGKDSRSWARAPQPSEIEGPPGLSVSGQAPRGALPSPPYSEEVDRSFRQQHQHNRQGASARQPSSSASPPLLARVQQQGRGARPASHSAGVTPARAWRRGAHMQIIRSSIRPADMASEQAAQEAQRPASTAETEQSLSSNMELAACTVSDRTPASVPAQAIDYSAEIEKLQSERALADEQAAQMAMQAQTLLQEKASLAARLAAQERQMSQLVEKLTYLEACAAESREGISADDADYFRQALAKSEEAKQHIAMMYYEKTGELPMGAIDEPAVA